MQPSCLHGERGEVTTTVMVVPLFLFMVFGVVQFGLAAHAKAVVTAAAQDGARAAQALDAPPGAGESAARGFVATHANTLLHDTSVVVDANGSTVHVEVTGQVNAVVPGITLRVRGVADGPIEKFRPSEITR
ncbi:MAG: TadE family protein [Acidimicrobiales bacterium]